MEKTANSLVMGRDSFYIHCLLNNPKIFLIHLLTYE
jgi:hypothetical protein